MSERAEMNSTIIYSPARSIDSIAKKRLCKSQFWKKNFVEKVISLISIILFDEKAQFDRVN